MQYKVIIPRKLVRSEVKTDHDPDNDYAIQMRIKWSFISEVEEWWNTHTGAVPSIMISRHDFEPPEYWVSFDNSTLADAFKLAWY